MKFVVPEKEIAKIHSKGNLCIFVGAGVSIGCGLPGWEELVNSIATKVWRYKKPTPSKEVIEFITSHTPTDIARLAKNEVGNELNRIIACCLYEDSKIEISDTVLSIVNSGVKHICTLNYDDLIEEGFGHEMIDCQSVENGSEFDIHNGKPIVYHPHGYLPRWAAHHEYKKYNVVLSDDDYSSLYSDPLSWANTLQTSLLVSRSALFIGLSMQDPNLKRLLLLAKNIGCRHYHYAVLPHPCLTMSGLKPNSYTRIQETITQDMLSRNVKVHWISEFDELSDYINRVFKGSRNS